MVSDAAGLIHKPFKDLMRVSRILRVVLPDKLHLLQNRLDIRTMVIEELFGFAFGGENFKCCLPLSL
jgi:hypothetical protein